MPTRPLARALRSLALVALATCTTDAPVEVARDAKPSAGRAGNGQAEVWVVDQSNTTGLAYGGAIHVYAVPDLMGASASSARPIARIDLGGATAALCLAATGANPVRPHMLFFNARHTHGVLSFVASGHVVIFDGATRAPVGCVRTTPGAGGAIQAHAAVPTPDDRHIVVANQNGKLLERIDTDYATNTFVHVPAATLNLATCTTPSGAPCEDPALRPDNAPICPVVAPGGPTTWVTLRGGGLFVVDPTRTPMAIVGEYDRAAIHGNGCGGAPAGGHVWLNAGGGTATNLHEFDVFRLPTSGYAAGNPPNVPAPELLMRDDVEPRDSHGTVVVKDHVWVFDRGANVAEVFRAGSGAHVATVSLPGGASDDPTPDLADVAPAGNRIFVSLRGPNPLSGDPHVATGSTPGLGVLHLQQGGARGSLVAVVPISNRDAAGVERADPHGIRVRVPR